MIILLHRSKNSCKSQTKVCKKLHKSLQIIEHFNKEKLAGIAGKIFRLPGHGITRARSIAARLNAPVGKKRNTIGTKVSKPGSTPLANCIF